MESQKQKQSVKRVFSWKSFGDLIPKNPLALLNIFYSLKNRNFAIYFGGMSVSLIGSWIQQVAMGWLVFSLTNSVFMLSLTVFLAQIPTLVFTPFTGIVCDRFNRKIILFCTQSLMMLQSIILTVMIFTHTINMTAIFILSFLLGVVVSFDAPARQSFYALLVPPKDLSNAIALNSSAMNGTRFIGPAIGGYIIAKYGEGICFLINSISYFAILLSLFFIHPKAVKREKSSKSAWSGIIEGFSYAASSMPIRTILLLLIAFGFFAMPFPLLLPAFSGKIFSGNSEVLGNMMSLIGCGSFAAALYLAARKAVFGLGRLIAISCCIFGVGLVIISFVKSIEIAYVLCVPIGFGMIAVAASCNTLLQTIVDDQMRGRVMSLFSMAFFGMPPLGSLMQGLLAKYISLEYIVLSCGVVCIIAAAIFEYFRPIVRTYVHQIYTKKGIILPEIAKGLQSSTAVRKIY